MKDTFNKCNEFIKKYPMGFIQICMVFILILLYFLCVLSEKDLPVISLLIIMVGWYFTHITRLEQNQQQHLQKLKQQKNQKELELRTKYLEDAFMAFAEYPLWRGTKDSIENLNEAVRKVNLFGSQELNNEVSELMELEKDRQPNEEVSYDSLLVVFRNEMRKELGLLPLPENTPIGWIRSKELIDYQTEQNFFKGMTLLKTVENEEGKKILGEVYSQKGLNWKELYKKI